MDYNKLAELLFPHIDKTPEYYEEHFPKRVLPEGAKVTRLGPSPTGFIHLGNLYGAFADERLAHQSGWFEKIRGITADLGYAVKPKDFKKHPEDYKGHVGHVSTVIRIALTGRAQSPDIWEIQQIMGEELTRERIKAQIK